MQEGLPPEHGGELVADTLEELLDRGGVTEEGDSLLLATRCNVTLGSENVVSIPLDEVSGVLVLDVLHLLLDLLHRDAATEDCSNLDKDILDSWMGKRSMSTYGEVTTVPWVRSSHHVLCIEHLLRELRHGDCTVLLASTGGKRRETSHEEVQTRERHYMI